MLDSDSNDENESGPTDSSIEDNEDNNEKKTKLLRMLVPIICMPSILNKWSEIKKINQSYVIADKENFWM